MKKYIKFILMFLIALVLLAGCSKTPEKGDKGDKGDKGEQGADGNGIKSIIKTSENGLEDTYTITFTDGSTTTFVVKNGKDGEGTQGEQGIQGIPGNPGEAGHTPVIKIGENGNWFIDGVDTNVKAQGAQGNPGEAGHTPVITIGENGNWFIDGVDTNVKAQGAQGNPGEAGHTPVITIGQNGNWFIDGVDTNVKAQGAQGNPGEAGKDGKGIVKIELTNQEGLVDTYTITYSDETTSTFTVTNGKDADNSITIGDNGNLFINDYDTGINVDPSKSSASELTVYQKITSRWCEYSLQQINGVFGYALTKFRFHLEPEDYYRYHDIISLEDYNEFCDSLDTNPRIDVVIPDSIGGLPVIAVEDGAFGNNIYLTNVKLSKNIIHLGTNAFNFCRALKTVDFNGAKVTSIGPNCFRDCEKVKFINMPNTVEYIGEAAFFNANVEEFDFTNTTYIGHYAFNKLMNCAYLPKTVSYVGNNAFGNGFLFLEHEEVPENWGENINGKFKYYSDPILNCKKNDDYIYQVKDDKVTLYQYIGSNTKLTIPEKIDGYDVKVIGSGFNTDLYTDWDSLIYDGFDYTIRKGHLIEVNVPSFIEVIEDHALTSFDTFVYIARGVKNIYTTFGNTLGAIVFEDTSYSTFYADGLAIDKRYLFDSSMACGYCRMYDNIDYSKVYYDEDTLTYYYNEGEYYSVLASFDFFSDKIVMADTINNLPVQLIGQYAYGFFKAEKIVIGSKVQKIKTEAFGRLDGKLRIETIYIPATCQIINANAFSFDTSIVYYFTDACKKQDDWDTVWAGTEPNVTYGYALKDFEEFKISHGFGYIVEDGKASLVHYFLDDEFEIDIPVELDDYEVTKIKTGFFKGDEQCEITIRENIEVIEAHAFENIGDEIFIFKFEFFSKPIGVDVNYYYNVTAGDNITDKNEIMLFE